MKSFTLLLALVVCTALQTFAQNTPTQGPTTGTSASSSPTSKAVIYVYLQCSAARKCRGQFPSFNIFANSNLVLAQNGSVGSGWRSKEPRVDHLYVRYETDPCSVDFSVQEFDDGVRITGSITPRWQTTTTWQYPQRWVWDKGLRVDVEAGKTYYVKYHIHWDRIPPDSGDLKLMNEAAGAKEMQKLLRSKEMQKLLR
jgi:hypothetical protein